MVASGVADAQRPDGHGDDAGRDEQRGPAGSRRTPPPSASAARRSSATSAGLAWPRVFFMTCPVRKPMALSVPARTSATAAGCSAMTSATAARSAASSLICCEASLGHEVGHRPTAAACSGEDLLGAGPGDGAVLHEAHEGRQLLPADAAPPRQLPPRPWPAAGTRPSPSWRASWATAADRPRSADSKSAVAVGVADEDLRRRTRDRPSSSR